MIEIALSPHPLLDLQAFVSVLPAPLGQLEITPGTAAWLLAEAPAPMASSDEVRTAVRDLLRCGGFKPTGRSKPASEYLRNAALQQPLSPINLAVDVANAVSLHSGLPISVIDLERAELPLAAAIAPAGAEYVFNPTGQTIDLGGLLCLCDANGPCANAVKDSQRTKTHEGTKRTLTVIWGAHSLPGRAAAAAAWYRELLAAEGVATESAALHAAAG
ncbi:phenylalanine--tRNA ligase beta subunit-related protein [Lignipirellula cremea]|uniref:B3/4 domain protein n=1 Tax=Lignipirellula cremea TaxID=2528010 RepID=A0A518E2R1_9BACT|nr:phenylalanine--tRNA ligase beta subunit-related protein [Lignipirellula cremea]QDU98381.1 B3/4 domain protein [Lignipirellula cremea]